VKLARVTALVQACSGTKGDSEVSRVEEEGSVRKTGGTRLLETMRIGCGVGPDRQPSESTRLTIASKTHLAKVGLPGILWKDLYIS